MPSFAATCGAVAAPSPVAITTRTPAAFSAAIAAGVVGLDRISNREQSEQSVFNTDEHDRVAFAANSIRLPRLIAARSMPASLRKRALPRRSAACGRRFPARRGR